MTGSAGRVAVVTGASSGIGAATARALAQDGAQVALLARNGAALEALAAELPGALPVVADVTDRASLEHAAARVAERLGRTDILVNAAGEGLIAPFGPDGHDDIRRVIEVNLLGAIATTAVFLDQLRDGGGDLVNISSVGGRKARPTVSVYNGTKWGIHGWSEGLRQELLPDVRVIVVGPGAVDTPLFDKIAHQGAGDAFKSQYPKDEMLRPEDVAEVVVFAVGRPRHVSLSEILIRPSTQVY